jgi:hypothetical protein
MQLSSICQIGQNSTKRSRWRTQTPSIRSGMFILSMHLSSRTRRDIRKLRITSLRQERPRKLSICTSISLTSTQHYKLPDNMIHNQFPQSSSTRQRLSSISVNSLKLKLASLTQANPSSPLKCTPILKTSNKPSELLVSMLRTSFNRSWANTPE